MRRKLYYYPQFNTQCLSTTGAWVGTTSSTANIELYREYEDDVDEDLYCDYCGSMISQAYLEKKGTCQQCGAPPPRR